MSRIGKRPVVLPSGVEAKVSGTTVHVKGPKGVLARDLGLLSFVSLKLDGKSLSVDRTVDSREARREQGLIRALIQGMVNGAASGFSRDLEIVGVGYKAEVKGKSLSLNLGFSHPIDFPIPEGIHIGVEKQTRLSISGADHSLVGETAARIRRIRPPEPYKGKGIKYTNEVIRRKVGKTAGGTAKTGA